MRQKLTKLLFIVSFIGSFGLLSLPIQANAYYGYGPGPVRCAWIGGHWQRGYWMPAHRACWGVGYYPGYYRGYYPGYYHRPYYGCGWVPGHWRYGAWIPGYRVCR